MAVANSNTFTLSFHKGSQQYCKTVNGRRFYLGKDHDEALETWIKFKHDFAGGIDPRKTSTGKTKRLKLRDGCNLFLEKKHSQVAAATFTSLKYQCKTLIEFFGPDVAIDSLGPDHFERLNKTFVTESPISQGNKILRTRGILNWLADREYIEKPKFGLDFKPPGKKAVRRHRRQQAERVLTPEEFRNITNELGVQMRAAAFLGLNCGFGPSDIYKLPKSVVDLDGEVIHWPRVKTEADRVCPLWQETVDALQLWDLCRTKDGKRFFEYRSADYVSGGFHEGVKAASRKRKGLSFYSLRHTLATVGRQANDDAALKLIMGHVDDSMLNEHYTHDFPRERLDNVSEHVRVWLFGKGKP